MRPHYARKESEAQNTLAIVMFHAFVIDERDFFLQNGIKQLAVICLLLFCMGEEEVGLARDQVINRHFLDPKKQIAIVQLLPYFNTRRQVFAVGKATYGRRLNDHPDIGKILLYPFTLRRSKRHPVIRRYFSFANESDSDHKADKGSKGEQNFGNLKRFSRLFGFAGKERH